MLRPPLRRCLPARPPPSPPPQPVLLARPRPLRRCLPRGSMASVDLVRAEHVAIAAAKEAGAVIQAAFHREKHVQTKGNPVDLVTETDQECERIVLDAISAAFPDHAFIGEEGSAAQGFTSTLTDQPTWLVDPVDGTSNFCHRFPFVCVCIGLAIKREVVVGVVYNPILQELFTAVKAHGARCNGQPIHVSGTTNLRNALLITEVGVTRDEETLAALYGRISTLTPQTRSVRCLGSCALGMCSVACGRAELMYEVGFGGPWDCAAAALIVTEAGGQVMDPAGGPFNLMSRRVLAANASLGPEAAKIIAPLKLGPHEPRPVDQDDLKVS